MHAAGVGVSGASSFAIAGALAAAFGPPSSFLFGGCAALLALSSRETLAKVAEAMSVQAFVGGKTVVDVIDKVFAGTPLAGLLDKVKHRSAGANGEPAQLTP